jgi:cerevisin
MSLGGLVTKPLDKAVKSLTRSHVHVAVAAGNSGFDSNFFSPARAPSAVTVAATDITDKRPSWSNFGGPVKIFAPGQDIISAWNTNDTVCQMLFHSG